jgi:DNA-binding PadR family transcriptional regulator
MHRHFGFGGREYHGRHGFGFHHHERGHGRHGMRRMFDHGDLRFVVLKLIAEKPRHGYELIKAIEEASGGAYAPSPGVIYPTLTLLEEMGMVTAEAQAGGKKLHSITPEGEAYLAANQAGVTGLFGRLAEAASRSTMFSPQILRARENLRTALKLKTTGQALTPDQIAVICDALDAAASSIERA